MRRIRTLIRQENGQALAEYGPVLVFVGIAAIAALTLFGGNLKLMFENIAASFH